MITSLGLSSSESHKGKCRLCEAKTNKLWWWDVSISILAYTLAPRHGFWNNYYKKSFLSDMRCSCHLLVLFVFLCRNAGRSSAEQPEDRRRSWSRKRWVVELNTDIIGTKVIWSKIFYPITVNQMEARESDMSDTLSPSRDRSSDDTSDGNEDEEELNQRQNRVSLHQGKGQRSGSGQRSGQRLNNSVKVNRRSLILKEVNPVCVCV